MIRYPPPSVARRMLTPPELRGAPVELPVSSRLLARLLAHLLGVPRENVRERERKEA